MTSALRAEWTKLRTLALTGWLIAATVATTIGVSAAVAASTHISHGGREDPMKLALTGVYLGQAVVAVFAVLVVCEEYATGMILLTLSAVPRRVSVLAAKASHVVGIALGAGLLAVAGSMIAGRLLLPAAGIDPAHGYALISVGEAGTARAALGSALYLALVGALSLGVATVIRDTAVSIGAVLALLYLPPILAQLMSEPLRRHIEQIAPMSAGLAIQSTTDLRSLPIAPWAGLGILAAWALAALLAGGLALRLRDA